MDTNTPLKLIKPHDESKKSSLTTLESSNSVLNYALKFQSQPCIETLIQTYKECIQSILNINGIRYRYPLLNITYSRGSTDTTQCNFHLNTDEEFWGDITIYSKDALTDHEMKNIELISSLLVHPLRSVIQQKSYSLLSSNEETTGIANSTLVEQLVTREAKLSYRERVPMSLILLDIDRFQKFSQSENYIARDEILYNVMHVMRNNIRNTDLLFRYDNNTYCLILKGVTGKNAFDISERLRSAIDSHKFKPSNHKAIHITASAGISELLATDSIESIFERTTNAMQHAKKMGRNQSILADGTFIN
ncbi:MAG: GGDEF domain-containing protein [Gammaproteobacteria bacterium]